MKKTIFALAATALVLGAPGVQAKEKKSGEEKLAEMLEGYEAGEPQSCIPTNDSDGLQIIEDTALVYKRGKTIYVNRPANPKSLDWDDVLLITRFSSTQLCRQDQIKTIDRMGGFVTGVVFLSDFIPYTKVEAAAE